MRAPLATVAFCTLLSLASGIAARAATRYVPGDYPTIQAAVTAAVSGDVVRVAPGVYTGPGNVSVNLGTKNLEIRSEAGAAVTTIDGAITGGPCSVAPAVIGFIMTGGQTRDCIIDGFTIKRCASWADAGAIQLVGSSPIIRNCVFTGDHACANGGAISAASGSSPLIELCDFSANSAGSPSGGDGDFTIYGGGAIYTADDCPSEILACTFENNYAPQGGAVRAGAGTTVVNCVFTGNSAAGIGDAGGGAVVTSTADIEGCTFKDNAAPGGGAVCCYGDNTITASLFVGNTLQELSYPYSTHGAAVQAVGTAVLTHCTFWGNRYPGQAGRGDDVVAGGVDLDRCIVCYNDETGQSPRHSYTCCDLFDTDAAARASTSASPDFTFIAEDPLLCDPEDGDFRLQPDSPCLARCGRMGAFDQGCGVTATESHTWSAVKARFR